MYDHDVAASWTWVRNLTTTMPTSTPVEDVTVEPPDKVAGARPPELVAPLVVPLAGDDAPPVDVVVSLELLGSAVKCLTEGILGL